MNVTSFLYFLFTFKQAYSKDFQYNAITVRNFLGFAIVVDLEKSRLTPLSSKAPQVADNSCNAQIIKSCSERRFVTSGSIANVELFVDIKLSDTTLLSRKFECAGTAAR